MERKTRKTWPSKAWLLTTEKEKLKTAEEIEMKNNSKILKFYFGEIIYASKTGFVLLLESGISCQKKSVHKNIFLKLENL